MMRRLLLILLTLGGVVFLVSLGGGRGVVSIVFGWVVMAYLLRCAAPVIRSDLHVVRALFPSLSRRGDHL